MLISCIEGLIEAHPPLWNRAYHILGVIADEEKLKYQIHTWTSKPRQGKKNNFGRGTQKERYENPEVALSRDISDSTIRSQSTLIQSVTTECTASSR